MADDLLMKGHQTVVLTFGEWGDVVGSLNSTLGILKQCDDTDELQQKVMTRIEALLDNIKGQLGSAPIVPAIAFKSR